MICPDRDSNNILRQHTFYYEVLWWIEADMGKGNNTTKDLVQAKFMYLSGFLALLSIQMLWIWIQGYFRFAYEGNLMLHILQEDNLIFVWIIWIVFIPCFYYSLKLDLEKWKRMLNWKSLVRYVCFFLNYKMNINDVLILNDNEG